MKKVVCAAVCVLLLSIHVQAQNRYVYLNNQAGPNQITAWQIESDGSLTQLTNSPFNTGGQGQSGPVESMAIVRTEAGPILYAANGGDPSVSGLTIAPDTGDLTPIAGSPFAVTDTAGTYSVAASPSGQFLFVANEGANSIHVYAISKQTGALSEISDSPFAAGQNLSGLWVTANGKFLLAGGGTTTGTVQVYSIAGSGAITQVPSSPFPANASVSDLRSNCASDRVYTADNGSAYIDGYVMSTDGALKPVPRSPFFNGATGSGPNSFDLAIAPNGRFVFTTDSFSDLVTSFGVDHNGALTQVKGSPFNTSGWVGGTAITAKGDYLYSVSFADGSIVAQAIAADGTMTLIGSFNGGDIPQNGEANSVISYPPPVCATAVAQ